MPYRRHSQKATISSMGTSLVVGAILVIAGTVDWKTIILEEVLAVTKQWFQILGIFMLIANIVGLVSVKFINKALLWTFLASTLIIAIVLISHAYYDLVNLDNTVERTDKILRESYIHYNTNSYKTKIDNFQNLRRCCGYNGTSDVHVQTPDGLIKSCCHKKVKKCTVKSAYKESCSAKKIYIYKLTIMCAVLGLVAATTELLSICFIAYGWIKHLMEVAKEQTRRMSHPIRSRASSHTSHITTSTRISYDLSTVTLH